VPDIVHVTALGRAVVRTVGGMLVSGVRLARPVRVVRPAAPSVELGRGVALRGAMWTGGAAAAYDGTVVVDPDGRIATLGPAAAVRVPAGVRVLGGPDCWIGPGVVDAHVHLAFGTAEAALRGGVVGVRDLGAPRADALRWRTGHRRPPAGRPYIGVAGPILTAPGGYPSRSWGADGFAAFVANPAGARQTVRQLAGDGVDLVKIALEPGAEEGWPVPAPAVVRAVVDAAHDAGLRVSAHALTVDMVGRAVDAGVDELAHTPVQRLPEPLVDRIAAAGIWVVSTLQTFFTAGVGRDAAANAAALHRAGVPLVYGTDLGNAGTRPGVDPRELDRLADAGLGRLGALRAATERAARLVGVRGRTGTLTRGQPAALVLLSGDPLVEPGVWRSPSAVLCDGRLLESRPPAAHPPDRPRNAEESA
jgi:imidazolonepropionase-like amidohydrolase